MSLGSTTTRDRRIRVTPSSDASTRSRAHRGGCRPASPRELRAVGVQPQLRPGCRHQLEPEQPVIGVRSFGSEPALVARHSARVGRRARGRRGRHLGEALSRATATPPRTRTSRCRSSTCRSRPARRASSCRSSRRSRPGASAIMTSHILLPQLDPRSRRPSRRRFLQELLRDELGFDGVIVSDALDMVGASGRDRHS